MLKKLDITNFGIFKNFDWKQHVGNFEGANFKRLNIIYGRNYSGKTTVSRIFRALELKEPHKDYLDIDFLFLSDDDMTINEKDILNFNLYDINVYNSDFVADNLNWLRNTDGSIKPFTVLGDINKEVENQIEKINKNLGKVESGIGLLYEQAKLKEDYDKVKNDAKEASDNLDKKLRNKARKIKNNAMLYNRTNYNITKLKSDLKISNTKNILTEGKKESHRKVINIQNLDEIKLLSNISLSYGEYYKATEELLNKKVKLTEPIKELIEDNILEKWVSDGVSIHKGKRDNCAFCGGPIPSTLWSKLDKHFSKESKDFKKKITQLINKFEKVMVSNIEIELDVKKFYPELRDEISEFIDQYNQKIDKYKRNISILIDSLESKKKHLYEELSVEEYINIEEEFSEVLEKINTLIKKNNKYVENLNNNKEEARKALLLSCVETYKKDIQYEDSLKIIQNKEKIIAPSKEEYEKKVKQVNEKKLEKEKLIASLQDESRGADAVNNYISRYFGHDNLSLKAVGEKPQIKFEIYRGNKTAKNLSEGEASLISFCYFIARINDKLKADNSNKPIIYIDDPISSLDNNHIFFMFSLIENIIVKKGYFKQLFISTHNLDFLKYMKRLTGANQNELINHYIIERVKKQNSIRSEIRIMPKFLSKYSTEFNYLFNEMYELYKDSSGSKKQKIDNTFNKFYSLPNSIRKFLECYLFYKYPNNNHPLDNLNKLFDGEVPCLINRVINEYSHLTYIDRGWKPIDVPEMETCVQMIFEALKEKDEEQFNELVNSVS